MTQTILKPSVDFFTAPNAAYAYSVSISKGLGTIIRRSVIIAADTQPQAIFAATRLLLDDKECNSINLHSHMLGKLEHLA